MFYVQQILHRYVEEDHILYVWNMYTEPFLFKNNRVQGIYYLVATGFSEARRLDPEHKSTQNDESDSIDHVAECQRLREQLERVMIDHQRQEEEIVALRALAKSLKQEVETIQEKQQLQIPPLSSPEFT
eukprot:jgi/Phyca11/15004/fgenesh1_pg.PHYCAscaffold_10_\